MLAVDPLAMAITASVNKPAEAVVVSRDTRSELLVSRDTPVPLIKGGATEDALLRQGLSLTGVLTVVRPTADAEGDILRWTYQSYLQRQLCFTSITGLFSCAAVEVQELTDEAAGEAPLMPTSDQAATNANPAEAVRVAVATGLRARAAGLFAEDRRLKLDPMLKAAGVSIRRPAVAPSAVRR